LRHRHCFEIDLLADEPVTMSFMADRLRTAAPGMLGGDSGATGRVLLDGIAVDVRNAWWRRVRVR